MVAKDKEGKEITFSLGYKVWLEKDDVVQGDGFFQILKLIEQSGSIAGAAYAMRMSYRAVWGKIKTVEKTWGVSLVITKVGGREGGGAYLTPEAFQLLDDYHLFREQVDKEINRIFKQVFSV